MDREKEIDTLVEGYNNIKDRLDAEPEEVASGICKFNVDGYHVVLIVTSHAHLEEQDKHEYTEEEENDDKNTVH